MGFGKAKYDVEEKGLTPTIPHNQVGLDGRLVPSTTPVVVEEKVVVLAKEETTSPVEPPKVSITVLENVTVIERPATENTNMIVIDPPSVEEPEKEEVVEQPTTVVEDKPKKVAFPKKPTKNKK